MHGVWTRNRGVQSLGNDIAISQIVGYGAIAFAIFKMHEQWLINEEIERIIGSMLAYYKRLTRRFF